MVTALYFEIDLFAMFCLLVILDREKNGYTPPDQKIFKAILISLSVVLLTDAFTWALNEKMFTGAVPLTFAINEIHWISTMFPSYFSLLYCISVTFKTISRKVVLISSIPVFFGLVVILLNPFFNIVFSISSNNVYSRGPLFRVVSSMPMVHMLSAAIVILVSFFKFKGSSRRNYVTLIYFIIIPLIGTVIQIQIYGLVTIWISLAIALVMCYVNIQTGNVSLDILTGLNNRRRFDEYVKSHWRMIKGNNTFYLILLDIDDFKQINDNYGHNEGDKALVRAAGILKSSMADEKGLIARIGGDEFAIVAIDILEADAKRIIDKIEMFSKKENNSVGKPYNIRFSVGYSGVTGENKSDFHKLYDIADDNMYQQKRLKKNAVK